MKNDEHIPLSELLFLWFARQLDVLCTMSQFVVQAATFFPLIQQSVRRCSDSTLSSSGILQGNKILQTSRTIKLSVFRKINKTS